MWLWDDGVIVAASIRRPSLLTDRHVRELTGLSRSQYARLIAEVGAAWESEREAPLSARTRERAFGAGRKHSLPFAGRLLLAIMYLRWNVTMRFLAEVFGSDKDSVNRAVAELTPLLAEVGITVPDGTRIGDDDTLAAQLRALSKSERATLIDGTFVPIPRARQGRLGGAEGSVLDASSPSRQHVPGAHRRSREPVVGR